MVTVTLVALRWGRKLGSGRKTRHDLCVLSWRYWWGAYIYTSVKQLETQAWILTEAGTKIFTMKVVIETQKKKKSYPNDSETIHKKPRSQRWGSRNRSFERSGEKNEDLGTSVSRLSFSVMHPWENQFLKGKGLSGLIVWGILVYNRAGDDIAFRTVLGYSTASYEDETEQKPPTHNPWTGHTARQHSTQHGRGPGFAS